MKHVWIATVLCGLLFTDIHAMSESKRAKKPSNIRINKVHIVSMNHLDVGYSDGVLSDVGFVSQVLNRYLTKYFPTAINTSLALINGGYVERFVYTTHPWLVSLYLDCPKIQLLNTSIQCPSDSDKQRFVQAVQDGHIAWHATPMNLQTDNMGADLFAAGIMIGQRLDKQFGINRTHATMSQRDVPGITKATLPILLKMGVKAISVGVNPGTAPPAFPNIPFLWKSQKSDTDGIMAFWLPGGYPNNPGLDPANPGGLDPNKCIITYGLDEALCFAFRTDNTGPPVDPKEVLGWYEILRAEFPGAELVASTFDAFAASLESVKSLLPVFIAESGDTWIQGIASDPKKMAAYRAFERAWVECRQAGQCFDNDQRMINMLRYLVKLPEHTWGAHNILDFGNWTNKQLAEARKTIDYQLIENTWREQRQFLDLALAALEDHPLKQTVENAYNDLVAKTPDFSGYSQASVNKDYTCPGGFILKFGQDGSLIRLYDSVIGREWAGPSNPLGKLIYDTFDQQDFDNMGKQYNYNNGGAGYYKPNVTQYAHPESRRWQVAVSNLYMKTTETSCYFWVEAATVDSQTQTKYGAPQKFYVQYVTAPDLLAVNITLIMMGKVTTRLPESISFGFSPMNTGQAASWSIDKMGSSIDPCDVILNGSQYVHAVGEGVSIKDANGRGLQIFSPDVPVVTIGTTSKQDSPFPVPLSIINCAQITNMSFNIYNNIWNTNYIFWYPYEDGDENFKARFSVKFKEE